MASAYKIAFKNLEESLLSGSNLGYADWNTISEAVSDLVICPHSFRWLVLFLRFYNNTLSMRRLDYRDLNSARSVIRDTLENIFRGHHQRDFDIGLFSEGLELIRTVVFGNELKILELSLKRTRKTQPARIFDFLSIIGFPQLSLLFGRTVAEEELTRCLTCYCTTLVRFKLAKQLARPLSKISGTAFNSDLIVDNPEYNDEELLSSGISEDHTRSLEISLLKVGGQPVREYSISPGVLNELATDLVSSDALHAKPDVNCVKKTGLVDLLVDNCKKKGNYFRPDTLEILSSSLSKNNLDFSSHQGLEGAKLRLFLVFVFLSAGLEKSALLVLSSEFEKYSCGRCGSSLFATNFWKLESRPRRVWEH